MATENQKQFVSDIESAIAAIRMKTPGKTPERLTINEVCELAGRNSIEMRAMVLRIAGKPEDGHLLRRLQHAFNTVGLNPQYLASVLLESEQKGQQVQSEQKAAPEPLKLSATQATSQQAPAPSVPKLVTQSQAIEMPGVSRQLSAGEAMNQVIQILDPLPEKQQRRVIVSVSAYYGIGE
jgi:hypothetical protein